jgi:apolipoprotein N-acyltransferase
MDALPELFLRLPTWKLAFISAIAGALSVLAMAPSFLWPIMFLTFPLLIWTLDAVCFREIGDENPFIAFRRRVLRSAAIGWAFGFGYFLLSIYWIGYAFYVDAERYAALMPFAVAALPAALALFYAAAAALAAAMWRRGYPRLLAFAFAFFCFEAARGYLFTGFPWNLIGEALAATDQHMQLAAYVGVYGLTLAALFIFSAPAAAIAAPAARCGRLGAPIFLAALVLFAGYLIGFHRLQQTPSEVEGVRIRIVQPNIPQREKWNPDNRRWIFERVISLSRNGTSSEDVSAFTHVIWPESSVPFLFMFNREIFSADARDILASLIPPHTVFILGGERAEGILSVDNRYSFNRVFNSLFVLGEGARLRNVYDKHHLVPFGEYMPFRDTLALAGFRAFSHRLDGFEAGPGQPPAIETPAAPAFLPLICYEIIFPGITGNTEKRPKWIVNVTNDAWFGDSTGPYQHLHQARIRAVEEGLPVMRAANTGISAVIDPFGRVLAKLDLGVAGVIDHKLPQSLAITFYEKTRLAAFIMLILFPLQFYLVMVAFVKDE